MKKELQQQKTQPWQIPPVLSFYLKRPLYLILTCPNSLFSKAQTKCNCLLKIFCDSSSQKETLHHPDDHSTLSDLFSKFYPSSSLLSIEERLYLKATFPLKVAGFYSSLISLSPINSSTLRQPSMVVKMKTWAQKFDMRDTNPNCTAYWLLLAVWSWLSHFTFLNLGSLIFNR